MGLIVAVIVICLFIDYRLVEHHNIITKKLDELLKDKTSISKDITESKTGDPVNSPNNR